MLSLPALSRPASSAAGGGVKSSPLRPLRSFEQERDEAPSRRWDAHASCLDRIVPVPREETALEANAARMLRHLCGRGERPAAELSSSEVEQLLLLVLRHDVRPLLGLEGYAPRFLAAAVAGFPGWDASQLERLLQVGGTTSPTVAGDGQVIRCVLAHPSCTLEIVASVLLATRSTPAASWVGPLVRPLGPAAERMERLTRSARFDASPGSLPAVLRLVAEGGVPLLEVYDRLRADSGASENDLSQVARFLHLASLALS